MTFCVFLESCRFGVPAAFRHDSRMQLVKERDMGVLCSGLFRVREFIERHGINRLLECTSVYPAVGFLAIHQMTAAECSARRCVDWTTYSYGIGVVRPLE